MVLSHQRTQVILLFLLASIALALGMGKAPLFLEEPRRALVAMEMLYSGDYMHTTIHGAAYYNKPPLFNWIIGAGFSTFGYHEWILRAITVVSHLLIGWMVYLVGKKYMSGTTGLTAAALYIAGADILYYFSLLGEIDVFFSLLVVAGWFGYFHYGERKRPSRPYLCLYGFMALAFLTKGLPAILFLGLTLVVWQWYKRDWKGLFSLSHITGVVLFLVILGLYFYPFVAKGDFDTLLQTFWSQSIERTTAEADFFKRVLSIFTFPLSLVKDILPGGVLLLFFSNRPFRESFYANRLFAFCCLVFAANIWVYWVSPDSRSRYMYMFHPLLFLPIVWMYIQRQTDNRFNKWVDGIFRVLPILIAVLLLAAIFLVPVFLPTKGVFWILPFSMLASLAVLYFGKKAGWGNIYVTVMMMLVLRMAFGWIVGSERQQHSQASKDKAVGIELAARVGDGPVYLLDSTRISTTISYYLQRDLGRIVPFTYKPSVGDHIILPDSLIGGNMVVEKQFTYQYKDYSMVSIR